MIDYVITEERGKEGIERMEVGERIDSDHFPLIVSITGERKLESESKGKDGEEIGQRKV